MSMESVWASIAQKISKTTGNPFVARSAQSVGGGCINSASVLQDNDRRYFIKLNDAARVDMFKAEAAGLNEIAFTGTVRVPKPICWGTAGGHGYLVLEFLDLGRADFRSQERLGQQLAQMHRFTHEQYGWKINNTIGSTPQINTQSSDWTQFWRDHRLGYQLELATRNGRNLFKKGERLLADLGTFFQNYRPVPSLLHGDLWSGNVGVARQQPVIYDPAVYYGDRETDVAMTELFGRFSGRFYQAYRDLWPLDDGYPARKTLYNLYHVLNHYNLFGGNYEAQAEHMMDLLLSELR